MKQIYLFSGLGADYRAFEKLDFSDFYITHINWIIPNKDESIENYAYRISIQIKAKNPILIGLSFGGMVAVEVAKFVEVEKIILLASAKTKYEIPFYYKIPGKLKLHKLIPASILKRANFLSYWFFGVENKSEKQLLKSILKDTDSIFLKWALDKIVTWKNTVTKKGLIHIHGTSDRILPLKFVKADFKIKNGGHFMTLNKNIELSNLIESIIT
ncbi:alpha/beta hydrolase [Flavobacterium sp.]|uniref:alpha/beta hydrolase n=1 Tax=Flavobacterium sp. TaxID=239 RepID=UPI00286D1D42|nr:alpha/beta hydrolase [Flavobacterium sp.]